MKKPIFIILICLFMPTAYGAILGIGEDSTHAVIDTQKTYNADDVVVTATRIGILPNDAPSPIKVISFEMIQRINGTTVADLLNIIDGVQMKDYGTVGGTKNATFRGLSTENVSFLINGNPINDPQYGSVDLSLLSPDVIDHIEVSYGSSSALYGGNALGGVVNIITRHASVDVHARAKQEAGSFGARRTSAELQGHISTIGMIAGFSREVGDDYFPFLLHRQNNADTILYRRNADYRRTLVFLNSDYKSVEGIVLNASVQYVKFERGVPGSITSPSLARQNDEVFRTIVGFNSHIADNVLFTLNGIYSHSNEGYREPSDYSPTDLLYNSRSYSMNSQIEWSPVIWDRFLGGIEYSEGRLDVKGVSWGSPFAMNSIRVQKSAYMSNEITFRSDSKWFNRLSMYQIVRYDHFSDVKDDAFSPKIGINIQLNKQYGIHIRSSWGENFRVPTFNDLYYPMYSNPAVIPERSTAFDAGVIGELEQSGRQSLQATYFNIITKDKIVYGAGYIPYNLGKAENSGLEIQYDYHSLGGVVDAYFGFTFIDALKKDRQSMTDSTYGRQLPYVPKSMGTFGISFETELGRIDISQIVTGLRYINSDNSRSLPAYELTNMSITKKILFSYIKLELMCSVNNVFDTDYQLVEGYPMPGRSYKVSINVEY
jgi:outer membrane cobalamin receptor